MGARLGQSDTVRSPAGPQGQGKSPRSLPRGENGVSVNLRGFRDFSPQNSNGFCPKWIVFSHESVSGGVVPGAHKLCAPDAPCPGPFWSGLDADFGPKPSFVKIRFLFFLFFKITISELQHSKLQLSKAATQLNCLLTWVGRNA